jgi:hypothetical protein
MRNDCTVGKLSERNEAGDEEAICRRNRSCVSGVGVVCPESELEMDGPLTNDITFDTHNNDLTFVPCDISSECCNSESEPMATRFPPASNTMQDKPLHFMSSCFH